jgi:hypothetical protein
MIVLTGVGTTAGVSPASLTFPDQTTNTGSTPQAVSLTNMGGTPMNIWQIAISGANAADFSKTTTCGISLDTSAVCSINVTFTPSAVGARVAKLLLSDDGGGSPQAVPLSGNGVAPAVPAGAITLSSTANQEQTAAAQLNTSSLTFKIQTVGTTSLVRSVVFRNTGTMPVSIAGISISGPAHLDFTEASKCRPRLLPNESCSIRVRFQPHAMGVRTGVISILDNAPGSPHKFSVSGMGIEIERQVGTPVSPSLNHLAPRRRK